VFEDESHASIYSDRAKEGLSLFGNVPSYRFVEPTTDIQTGILNDTVTALGWSLLKNWLTRPSLSHATIDQRHNAVACFLRPENMTTASTLHNL
jgi:DNA mismatch repair protein MSH5